MTDIRYYEMREQECIQLAERYERCPEDQQKAAGARQAREDAAFYRRMIERARIEDADPECRAERQIAAGERAADEIYCSYFE